MKSAALTPSRAVLSVVAAAAGLLAFLPLWWTLVSGLTPGQDIFRSLSTLSVRLVFPTQPTAEHLGHLLAGSFARAMGNSVLIALVAVGLGVLLSALAAFGLAVFRFRGQNALFALVVVAFLIPFDAIALPLAALFRAWHLQNTYVALILPGVANGLAIFLLRQFFLGIPTDLAEAARVDGMGWWGIFWRIYLPLSRPALISAGILIFVFQWHAYLWPLLIATAPDLIVAPVALASFAGQIDVDFGQMFAGATLTAAVPLVVVLTLQRYFTHSLAATGGKE
jgi:multiple sugar transport system permease protein/putative chitobiose transport system permease protein